MSALAEPVDVITSCNGHLDATTDPSEHHCPAPIDLPNHPSPPCTNGHSATAEGSSEDLATAAATNSGDSNVAAAVDPSSPDTPTHRVGFSVELDSSAVDAKAQERYLTAKYPKQQMGLIRKRIAVEDWVDAQLKQLFNISDEDYETYDTILDLDDLLNCDTDAERTQYIQRKISHAPKDAAVLAKFTEELLQKANTL